MAAILEEVDSADALVLGFAGELLQRDRAVPHLSGTAGVPRLLALGAVVSQAALEGATAQGGAHLGIGGSRLSAAIGHGSSEGAAGCGQVPRRAASGKALGRIGGTECNAETVRERAAAGT